MSTYIIGDIQGCFETLSGLLRQIKWKSRDVIWCVGDLVNRGPHSLEVLRWAYTHRERVKVVLGNHDLHLLACYAGATQGYGDTLDECLSAPDLKDLMGWLQHQPLLYEETGVAMIHAGVNPSWSWREVRQRAKVAEDALQSEDGLSILASYHPNRKQALDHSIPLDPSPSWIDDLSWFTRARMLTSTYTLDEHFKGSPIQAPRHLTPWYQVYERHRSLRAFEYPQMLYFGHWAALGIYRGEATFALDSGCIWGRYLSALRLEDGAIFQHPTLERALTPKNQRHTQSHIIEIK